MMSQDETVDRIPLTPAGRRQMAEEIARLTVRIDELHRSVADAHEDRTADEDERAAMLGLVGELSVLQARLVEQEAVLARSIEPAPAPADVVGVGTTVRLRDAEGQESVYTLVSPAEAAAGLGRVSTDAPLGRALIGRRVGETITVEAPAGAWRALILEVGPHASQARPTGEPPRPEAVPAKSRGR